MEVLYPGSSQTQREFALKFVELSEETATMVDPLVVTPYSVVHPSGAPAYALRVVCEDKIIAYSGDTEWTEALVRTANGADLFVCECFSPERVGA
jgi:ribonuclease BN (tRNA processing enzyme)